MHSVATGTFLSDASGKEYGQTERWKLGGGHPEVPQNLNQNKKGKANRHYD